MQRDSLNTMILTILLAITLIIVALFLFGVLDLSDIGAWLLAPIGYWSSKKGLTFKL